jgi:hypothetical protein
VSREGKSIKGGDSLKIFQLRLSSPLNQRAGRVSCVDSSFLTVDFSYFYYSMQISSCRSVDRRNELLFSNPSDSSHAQPQLHQVQIHPLKPSLSSFRTKSNVIKNGD